MFCSKSRVWRRERGVHGSAICSRFPYTTFHASLTDRFARTWYNGGMKPQVHRLGRSTPRDSHAKCVRIYRRTGSRPVISCGFRPNPAMAPTLLIRRKGSGRNQPFSPSSMKRTQVAAVKLCPALADGGVTHCTESRSLPVATWLTISFRPVIHSSTGRFCRDDVAGEESQINELVCLPHTRSATGNFLSLRGKKPLFRNRSKVL